jgi:hypothetical protein
LSRKEEESERLDQGLEELQRFKLPADYRINWRWAASTKSCTMMMQLCSIRSLSLSLLFRSPVRNVFSLQPGNEDCTLSSPSSFNQNKAAHYFTATGRHNNGIPDVSRRRWGRPTWYHGPDPGVSAPKIHSWRMNRTRKTMGIFWTPRAAPMLLAFPGWQSVQHLKLPPFLFQLRTRRMC